MCEMQFLKFLREDVKKKINDHEMKNSILQAIYYVYFNVCASTVLSNCFWSFCSTTLLLCVFSFESACLYEVLIGDS